MAAVCGPAIRAIYPTALPASTMTSPRASVYQPLPATEAAAHSASTSTRHANAARPCQIAMGDSVYTKICFQEHPARACAVHGYEKGKAKPSNVTKY